MVKLFIQEAEQKRKDELKPPKVSASKKKEPRLLAKKAIDVKVTDKAIDEERYEEEKVPVRDEA